jgi:pyruvate,orthophosphate dikinase
MVFGNAGPGSGSGVGFTRSPADGSVGLYCDYLPNAQGEDVVSGRRSAVGVDELERRLPEAFRQLMSFKDVLEKTYGDMQDFEFTVEDGHLFMLQARSGKRTPLAALRIANDLVAENVIRPQEALARLNGLDVESIEIRELVVRKGLEPAGKAIPASSGVAVGVAVMDPLRVGLFSNKGNSAVLLCDRLETSDIDAVAAAGAIVTSIGARTSHAAVVARQLGKVCLVGCKELTVDASRRSCRLGDKKIVEGDAISLDGNSGLIYLGKAQVRMTRPSKLLDAMHNWQTMTATK